MYEFVQSSSIKPFKKDCDLMLKNAQDLLRENGIRFQPVLIGSGASGLVTRDGSGSFDLDYNLLFFSVPGPYVTNPGRLKEIVRRVIDQNILNGFTHGQDSTASITYVKHESGKTVFSFDVALILKGKNGRPDSRLIHDKSGNRYIWNEIRGSEKAAARAKELKKAGQNNLIRKYYLDLKNQNLSKQTDKSSYVIYIEAVNLAFQSYRKEAGKMSKVSGNTHTQSQMDHHANQGNPNNAAHSAAQNNHANQSNPNNAAYRSSWSGGKK